MERPYYVIDVFTSEPFTGNPAAVIVDAYGLADRRMQEVAAEFNLSETTFVLPRHYTDVLAAAVPDDISDRVFYFRWFTPTTEVDMCGHATIAGVHALVESGRLPYADKTDNARIRIETRSGTLTAFVERIPGSESDRMIWLDLIDPILTPHPLDKTELAATLSLPTDAFEKSLPVTKTQDGDVLVFVRDFQLVNEAKPDFAKLARLMEREGLRGMSLATTNTLTPSINLQSRFFAPTCGVDEDPVTGSVHGPLAAYLVKHGLVELHDGLAGVTCVQAIPGGRTGLLHALVQPQGRDKYAVRIGGRAVTTMRGTLIE